jgi:hypothetical protein
VSLRDVGFFVRGRINSGIGRLLSGSARAPLPPPVPLEQAIAGADTLDGRVALLERRSNAEREAAVARYLTGRGVEVVRHRFATFEGAGENFSVDVGAGDRLLVLIAHHDAVPGSPGANDNAAAVAILLELLERLLRAAPRRLRVRLLFTAAEELGYLGARAYVREVAPPGVAGVLSLELCGIGDTLAIWDAPADTPFSRRVGAALDGLGLRRDESWHQVGRIPVFGSDHRAFAQAGIPAYGLTVVPVAEADALRSFVFSPVRSALRNLVRRPPPFDTYHTSRDAGTTLDPAAMALVGRALDAVIAELAG